MKPISITPLLTYTVIARKSIVTIVLVLLANLVFAQPTISSFSPVSGAPGTAVTITGTGFNATASANIVYFGPVKGTVTAATATSLTVTVPASAGHQPFSVTTGNFTAYSAKPFTIAMPGMDPLSSDVLSTTKGAAYITWNDSKNALAPIDLNADGKPEIVATQDWSNYLNLFTNNSSPRHIGFSTNMPYDIGGAGKDIAAGDLNGDGIPEVLVAKEQSDQVSIYDNTLSNIYNTGITGGPNSFAITDLDGDGKTDVVIGCHRSSTIVVLRNTSTGSTLSFSKQNIAVSGFMSKLAVRDMDGDGKPDICGIMPDLNALVILKNTYTTGNLTFTTSTFSTGTYPVHIQLDDLDGDDKPDIAVSNATGKTLSVFRNSSASGTIALDAKIDYTVTGMPTNISIADMDGDTKPDIALGDATNSSFVVFKNNSTSGAIDFTGITFTADMRANYIVITDFDGDGKNDVAIADINSNALQVLRNITGEPEITSFTPQEGDGTTTVTITGKNFNNVTSVSFGGTPAASFIVHSSTSITAIPAAAGSDGSVGVTTLLGSASKSSFNFLTPPTITGFTPSYGSTGGTVTINGTNFRGVTEVTLGGTKATVQFINTSGTSMQVTIRNGATGDVVVKTLDGTASRPGFTYYDKPTITSFTPASGHYGDTILITGTNFSGLQNVTFGGYVSIYRNAVSNTTIKAVVGTGATGDVLVKTPGGTAAMAGFIWLPPAPVITSFTPTSGIAGTVVTITGDNFTGAMDVQFGGVAATYTIVNSTTITAAITTGATGDVSVTGPGGTGTLAGFTFIPPAPAITSVNPLTAFTGDTITITGLHFSNTTHVSFGGTAAASFTVVSPNEITAVVGAGNTGNVAVTTPGGTATQAGFVFKEPPLIVLPTGLTVFPNPNRNRSMFYVQHPVAANDCWLRVVDMNGRVITAVKIAAGTYRNQVLLSSPLKLGYYYIGLHGAGIHKYTTMMVR
ncbi:IPT/TIG domain-containing protein [Niastella populi]|uniref:IPT/TIG domain-containing protein n=1 Tax=Niastella populi TaxID=550983 RepID=A0A1V9FV48_9BACT|nr:IPT/TIG domain-containing protein [Niastella populi]OQP62224.1 hypothetical protein A4R26_18280 [Niastella populi]